MNGMLNVHGDFERIEWRMQSSEWLMMEYGTNNVLIFENIHVKIHQLPAEDRRLASKPQQRLGYIQSMYLCS